MTAASLNKHSFLLEIGTEELPANVIDPAVAAVSNNFREMAAAEGLTHGTIRTFSTPRRLAILVSELTDWQADRTEEVLGPPLSVARDAAGNPTQAALSFAQKTGLSVDDLVVRPGKRGDVLAAVIRTPGRPARDVLMEMLPKVVSSIPFPQTMRWESRGFRFSRPVRWLVALLGSEVVPFGIADVTAGRQTWGHRVLAENPRVISDAESYEETLLEAHVVADSQRRAGQIAEGLASVMEQGYQVVADDELLAAVNNLVEWPHVALGTFAEGYLELPREVLITMMRYHLKVFAVEDTGGRLVNRFAVVLGTEPRSVELTLKGYVRVIGARAEDARFFYTEDTKKRLEERVGDLNGMLYLKGLGTVLERTRRLEKITLELSGHVEPLLSIPAVRAAHLCKADLTSLMVNEFPELQGVMGYLYALHDDENQDVANAIRDHYRPRWSGDVLPSNDISAIVALADKADAIAGCFTLGMIPKGSQDPYALRRAAIGILRILEERRYKIGYRGLLDIAFATIAEHNFDVPSTAREGAYGFVESRMRVLFSERFPDDLVNSVIATRTDIVSDVAARLEALQGARQEGWFDAAAAAFKRIQNITKNQTDTSYNPEILNEPAEKELLNAFQESSAELDSALAAGDYVRALSVLAKLKPRVDRFFDEVFVMAEDAQLRSSRLGLLKALGANFTRLADFTRIQVD